MLNIRSVDRTEAHYVGIRRHQAADLRCGAAQLAPFAENENTPLYSQCCALPNIVEQLSFSMLRSFVSLFRPSANKSFCLMPPDSPCLSFCYIIEHFLIADFSVFGDSFHDDLHISGIIGIVKSGGGFT